MSMRPILKGSTDQSVVIRIIDSTDGTPETGVDYNTSGIDLWYRREGATKTSITEATLAALDSAHSDGGIEHIGDGYYRLDLPDAAVASAAGVNGVQVGGTVTGMIVIGCYVPLVAYNPYDSVRMGMTALPNAAADAAGGLPISDAGGLDLDAKLANTNEVTAARMAALTDWIDGGRLDLIIDAIKAMTDKIGTVTNSGGTATIGAILGDFANSALASRVSDARMGALTDWINGGRLDLILDDILADTNELQSDDTPGALAALESHGDSAWATATGFSTHSAADVWTATNATLSMAYGVIAERLYRFLMNKMNITDASGAVALRNEADGADIATQTITDNDTTTVRTALSWA